MPTMTQPLTVDALWRLARIGSAGLSPDGRQAVCTVTQPDLQANRSSTSLWLLDTTGRRAPRPLTTANGRHAQPAWSPRGDRLAFIATRDQQGRRDDTPQLYLIAADGGEARRATAFAPGIEAFRWLPDGRGLLLAAWVWPDVRGAAAQARRHRAWQARQESGYATEEAQYRYWDHAHPQGRVLHLHRLDLANGRITDLFEGSPWELPRDETSPEAFDPSPDGRAVAFACDPAPRKVNGNRQIVVEMDLATRRTRRLADDPQWSFDLPRYAPDGRRLAVLAARNGIDHTMPWRPALVDRAGRRPRWRALGEQWDHEVSGAPRWSADGASFVVAAERQGRCPLWRCTPAPGDGRFEALDLAPGCGWTQGFDLAGSGGDEVLLMVADSQRHPPQVWARRGTAPARRLEAFNDKLLAAHALGDHEAVSFTGALGDPVQMWLTYPPGFDGRRRHPLLQVIHGGPYIAAGDTWSWRWNTQVLASHGHVVAQVNYHGSSGFGHAFKRSIMGRLATLEFQDIEAGSDWLLRQRWADGRRLFAAGGSYGGFMTAWINGHAAPGRYRARS